MNDMSNSGVNEESRFFFYVGELRNLKDEAKAVADRLKAMRKEAKADGFILESLDRALKDYEARGDDEEPASAKHEAYERYAAFLGMEIGKQTDLFEDHEPVKAILKKAETNGRQRALQGAAQADNPHDSTSSNGQAWLEGWHDGARQRRIILEMRAQVRKAEEGDGDEESPDGEGDELEKEIPF